MWWRLVLVSLLPLSFMVASPFESWAQKHEERHDCIKLRKGGYKCLRGPLAGRTFRSEKALIRAFTRAGPPVANGQHATGATSKKVIEKKPLENEAEAGKPRKRSFQR